ncbi:MAG TPA: hypothetical protein VHY91_24005 [Pirellulales bacterium]|jgi:hypothetical protein|nr:hypothetical protein [Pirellulales bacterium]
MDCQRFVLLLFVSAFFGCGSATEAPPRVGDWAVEPVKDLPAEPAPARTETAESAQELAAEIEAVQADARRLQNAFRDGDNAAFVELTYPKIIEAMGGPDKAQAAVEEATTKMQSAGMTIESMTFPEEPTFFASETQDFVFVPTLTIFAISGKRIESLSFLLGAKPRQTSKWTYIDGSEVGNPNFESWLPDFPPGRTFPKTYKKISP